MEQTIFIVLSTVVSLYAAYLFTCRLYKVDYNGEMEERVVFPRIVYILAFGVSFVPLLNLFCLLWSSAWIAIFSNEYRINSWLFDTPKQKGKETEGE